MFNHEITVQVRYAETDRMGYVYYGNYATYFEVARVECLRSLGVNYKDLEDSGIALPVSHYSVNYFKPAFYDQILKIKVYLKQASGVKITFEYETTDESGALLNKAETTLVFFDRANNKPCPPPKVFTDALRHISG